MVIVMKSLFILTTSACLLLLSTLSDTTFAIAKKSSGDMSEDHHPQMQAPKGNAVRNHRAVHGVAAVTTDAENKLIKGAIQSNSMNANSINQGQSTSTAYDHDYAAIQMDITFGADKPLTSNADGTIPLKTNTSKPKHATSGGQLVKSVGADKLHKAIAADALKKKLNAEEKKRLLLEQLAKHEKDTVQKDDVVMDLLSVSHE